jgi:hypothetical protein
MDEAIGEDAWEKLHGPHEIPKKYIPPFLQEEPKDEEPANDPLDNIYELEIDEGLNKDLNDQLKPQQAQNAGQGAQASMTFGEAELDKEEAIRYAGRGGNIKDMRFVRMKIKTLRVEDKALLQRLIDCKKFSLTVALPLPDVYRNEVQDQFIKLNNYDYVGPDEFEFTNLTLYNFKISEGTFNLLSGSQVQVMIDDESVHGSIPMNRLLLADNF